MRHIYVKVQKGDPLTDEEVDEGVKFFEDLDRRLIQLGPEFHLAWNEAARVARTLRSYQKARREHR
jgi:hypothetical protein